ncbi:ubiquitin-like protein Pup [Jonesia quinghaiensis]|uniref:ubiquitin-like protein Pup n=1 Tax=Jonesia quinghaiensis TaxID=262806 RepID=UPI00041C3A3C|nr:ubiquitin-like protein Pup [Jonesia quinghaiensis]
MAAREHQQPQRSRRDEDTPEPEQPPTPTQAAAQTNDADIDSFLDEIDDVLEINAETFVKGFVQKGGQ